MASDDNSLSAMEKIELLHRRTVGSTVQGKLRSYFVLQAISIANHANSFLLCAANEHTLFFKAEVYVFEDLCPQLLRSRKRHLKRRQKTAVDVAECDGQLYLIFDPTSGRQPTPKEPKEKYLAHSAAEVVNPKPRRPLSRYVRSLEASTARDIVSVFAARIDAVLATSKRLVDTSAGLDWTEDAAKQSQATVQPLEEAVTDARVDLANDLRQSLHIDWDQGTGTWGKESRECLRSFWEWDTADRAYRKALHDAGYVRPAPGEKIDDQSEEGRRMRYLQAMQESCLAQWQVFMHFLDAVFDYREPLKEEAFHLEFDDGLGMAEEKTGAIPSMGVVSDEEPRRKDAIASRKTVKQREKRRRRRARARCAEAGDS